MSRGYVWDPRLAVRQRGVGISDAAGCFAPEDERCASHEEVVYFIETEDASMVKIGRTRRLNPWKRFCQVRTGSPVPLVPPRCVVAPRGAERWLHLYFAKQASHGEWFRREGELAQMLDSERPMVEVLARLERYIPTDTELELWCRRNGFDVTRPLPELVTIA